MGWLKALRRTFVGMALLAVCAACGSSGTIQSDAALAQATVQDYRLGSGDRLRISVYGEEELTGEFVVSTTGVVSYPLIGDHPAQGKTVAEFTESLRTALTRYVLRPSMSVEVLNYRPFFILGEVQNPGTYPYSGGLNVMNAVATAGGFSYRADTRRVFIKHADEIAEREYALTSTTSVLPGDTVRIPERRF
jgi:polysaccharide export outer membrane protein